MDFFWTEKRKSITLHIFRQTTADMEIPTPITTQQQALAAKAVTELRQQFTEACSNTSHTWEIYGMNHIEHQNALLTANFIYALLNDAIANAKALGLEHV